LFANCVQTEFEISNTRLPQLGREGGTSFGLQQFNRTIFMQVGKEEGLVLFTNIFFWYSVFYTNPSIPCPP